MNVEKAAGETRAELADRIRDQIQQLPWDTTEKATVLRGQWLRANGDAILAALRVPAAPSFIPPLDLADQLQAAILEFRNPYQDPDTAPERAADLALWIVEHESRLLSALRASVPVRAGVDQRDRRPLHPPGLDAVTDAPAAPAATQIDAELRDLKAFSEAHHGDQPTHVLLHALVVDIPDRIDRMRAALAPSAGSSGTPEVAAWRVHNHGPEEGPGVACPERRLPSSGRLVGRCILNERPRHPAAPSLGEAE